MTRLVALFINVKPEINSEGAVRIAEAEAKRMFNPKFRVRDVQYSRKFEGCVVLMEEQEEVWRVRRKS